MQAVILAGGKGSRLKPFTTSIPKPLVPVGDLPILEIVLRQLKRAGVNHVIIAVNHLAELIMAFFGSGESLGLKIEYSREDQPLGTAGPLALINQLDSHFLLMNGDLLTTVRYQELARFHHDEHNDITLTLFKKDVKVDLGVIETRGSRFQNYIEKPTYHFEVSTGIYMIKRDSILPLINKNVRFDLPDLVRRAHDSKLKVGCFRGDFEWHDIGRPEDYALACELFEQYRSRYLPE